MLGQEDNPAQLRKEMERARQEAAERFEPAAGEAASGAGRRSPSGDGDASAEKRLFDPRSYLAKSVPQRMAIISAGVIMNMIFALVFAVVAFLCRREANPDGRGRRDGGRSRMAGGHAARRQDLEVAGRKVHNFRQMTEEIGDAELLRGSSSSRHQRSNDDRRQAGTVDGARNRRGTFRRPETQRRKNHIPFSPELAAANAKGPLCWVTGS